MNQQTAIRIGNFFFRWRNRVFPILVLALFALATPVPGFLGLDTPPGTKDLIAVLIGFSGLFVRGMVIGYAYIKRGGLNKQVYADKLVTEGLFTLCRNPLYLGNMLICISVFLMHGNPVIAVVGILLYYGIYYCIIAAEENFLRTKFGEDYEAYCRTTPRWIPVLSRFRTATEGMEFNFRRVILKDYTTIAVTTIALLLTKIYEIGASSEALDTSPALAWLGCGIGVMVVWVIVVRTLKKSRLLTEN